MVTSKINPSITLEYLCNSRENQNFDRKNSSISETDLANHIAGMANASGGILAVGIADKGEIIGFNNCPNKLNQFRKSIQYLNAEPEIKYEEINVINSKGKEATKFAKIKGIAGVHFDYVRFPGTAYQYKNAANAVNYFVKKASTAIHKVNSKLIVSAAIMPEPSSMKYYYGQDVPTMSKYVDVLMPMVYKGNYNAGRSWIKSTTKTFVSQSQHAKIWTGLQSYKSDSNVVKLSSSELKKDMRAALSGGAQGVILFRYGLFNLFDFSRL